MNQEPAEIIAEYLDNYLLNPDEAAEHILALLSEQGYSVVSLNTIMLGRYEK